MPGMRFSPHLAAHARGGNGAEGETYQLKSERETIPKFGNEAGPISEIARFHILSRSQHRRGRLRDSHWLGVFTKDPDFFEVMGMTALKTRNCLSASS